MTEHINKQTGIENTAIVGDNNTVNITQNINDKKDLLNNNTDILEEINRVNQNYLIRFENEKIGGNFIIREEVNQLLGKFYTETNRKGVVITGQAGLGKSGVIGQFIEKIKEQSIPFLAFRLDRCEPVKFLKDLGSQLGLSDSPTKVLATFADHKPCVLIIDQLDAVSQASGRNPLFFERIEELIHEAKQYENMQLLLACRKFDLDNDYRLKRLVGKNGNCAELILSPLPKSQVQEICNRLGFAQNTLTALQLEILQSPLHLKILEEIVEEVSLQNFNFTTLNELYDAYWKRKKDQVNESLGRQSGWNKVIDRLCEYMNKNMSLSVSEAYITEEDFSKDAEVMASHDVLDWCNKKVSFFHESFFDYAFARRFSISQQYLHEFLLGREQHLFYRNQVRQILHYRRQTNFNQYLDELKGLLIHVAIRFHIKRIILAWLTELSDPKIQEWEILEPFINNQSSQLTSLVWGLLSSSSKWFQLVDQQGFIENQLKSSHEEYIDRTIRVLKSIQIQFGDQSDRIAEILKPYIDTSEIWKERLIILVTWGKLYSGRKFFELFLTLIDNGTLDDWKNPMASNEDFWSRLYSLVDHCPEWACEAINHFLYRHLKISQQNNQSNPFSWQNSYITDSQFGEEILLKSAEVSSIAFVENILPFIIKLVELNGEKQINELHYDTVWEFRDYKGGYRIEGKLLEAIAIALGVIAKESPQTWHKINQKYNLTDSQYETLQYLTIRALTENGQEFGNFALDYLCDRPQRFETGYSGGVNTAFCWATKKLIESATPHCSDSQIHKLEDSLLNYYPEWEKKYEYCKARGWCQFILLDAIQDNRRSPKVIRRLQELNRKFIGNGRIKEAFCIETPKIPEAWIVGSPIAPTATNKMTDDQWLNAIAKYDYPDGATSWQKGGDLVGGAWQLSEELKQQTQQDPLRFVDILQRLPIATTNVHYFNGILRGIAESKIPVDIDVVSDVIHYCYKLPNNPCARSICSIFHNWNNLPWRNHDFDILIELAVKHPDPEEEFWQKKANRSDYYYGRDILTAGINSIRGSAASAVVKLIFADKNRATYFQDSVSQMVDDSSIAVRSCVAKILTAFLNYEQDLAVELFLKLCNTNIELLGTQTVEEFLRYSVSSYPVKLMPIIQRMITSRESSVLKAGVRQACLTVFNHQSFIFLVDQCLQSSSVHREAVAQIFSHNLRLPQCRPICELYLPSLFNDPDEKVRRICSRCFNGLEDDELGNYTELIKVFVNSRAFVTDCYPLINALEKNTAKLPDTICLIAEKFIDAYSVNAHNINCLGSQSLKKLIIRLYSQNSRNQGLQKRCLDIIDRMLENGDYEIEGILKDFDRQSSSF